MNIKVKANKTVFEQRASVDKENSIEMNAFNYK